MSATTVAKAALAAWEARDLDKTASLLAEDFVLTGPAPEPLGKAAFLMFQKVHNDAFADWSFNARDFQEQGQVVRSTIATGGNKRGDGSPVKRSAQGNGLKLGAEVLSKGVG